MSKSCCVCGEGKERKDNVLFNCKGHGCDVTVHQGMLDSVLFLFVEEGEVSGNSYLKITSGESVLIKL